MSFIPWRKTEITQAYIHYTRQKQEFEQWPVAPPKTSYTTLRIVAVMAWLPHIQSYTITEEKQQKLGEKITIYFVYGLLNNNLVSQTSIKSQDDWWIKNQRMGMEGVMG